MEFNYLSVNIISLGNLIKGTKTPNKKAAKVAGCLNDAVWRNKYMRNETKSKYISQPQARL